MLARLEASKTYYVLVYLKTMNLADALDHMIGITVVMSYTYALGRN